MIGKRQPYGVSLDWMSELLGQKDYGWSMNGFYQTVTDSQGKSDFHIVGTLRAPYYLYEDSVHYAILVMGKLPPNLDSKWEAAPLSEWFWCGWDPKNTQQMFQLGYTEKQKMAESHKRRVTDVQPTRKKNTGWKVTVKPKLNRNYMKWGAKRPYRSPFNDGLHLKLG